MPRRQFWRALELGRSARLCVRTDVRTYVATSLSVCVDEATQHSHIYVRTYVSLAYSRSCPAFAASRPHLLCTSCSASSVRRYRRVRTVRKTHRLMSCPFSTCPNHWACVMPNNRRTHTVARNILAHVWTRRIAWCLGCFRPPSSHCCVATHRSARSARMES